MKKILLGIFLAYIFLVGAGEIRAYEGDVEMSNSSISCKAISVWRENQYKLIGKCNGLVYPYETQYEHYYVWAHEIERDSLVRIGEIDRGYFEGNIKSSFDRLVVTAEESDNPRRPSEKEIVFGDVNEFSFDKVLEVEEEIVEEKPTSRVVQSGSDEEADEPTSTVGSVLGRIITALLAIVLIVIVIVVVGSLVFRRRGSVSG